MPVLIRLFTTILLPILVCAVFYVLSKKERFHRMPYRTKQALCGVAFGLVAALGGLFGIAIEGTTMTSGAAVLVAGLVFGGPAGILAGTLGAAVPLLAALGSQVIYDRLAGAITVFLAGVVAALLRKYMFEGKKPSALYAFLIGCMMGVLHMMLVFFTNLADVAQAFRVVEQAAPYMIPVNGLTLMLSVFVIRIISGDKIARKSKRHNITTEFQRWLLVCVLVAFAFTVGFTLLLQQRIFLKDTKDLLELNIRDVVSDISDASDENLLELTRMVAGRMKRGDDIRLIAFENNIAEINIIDDRGIITESTNPDFLGYDMRSGQQAAEFLVLLEDADEYVQSYQPVSHETKVMRKYAGVSLPDGGFVQVGHDAAHFQRDIAQEVVSAARNRHVGQSGTMIIANEHWQIVSDSNHNEGKNLYATGLWVDEENDLPYQVHEATVYGQPSYYMYAVSEGYYILSVQPAEEAVFIRNLSVYLTVFIEIVVFAALFILVYILIKKLVVNNIRQINQSLSEITGGNLDVVVNVRSNEEFASLSDDINSTVLTLKHYIDDAAARIDEELKFAKDIQHSALPSIFPPYPERKDFEIFASMHTAKEVGGDFYDFFFVGSEKLAFLIADVSGKGIPAAMFMMSAKSLIKGYAESGRSVEETFTLANEKLCEGNDAMMFVTAWLGILDLTTGVLEYANAGHNPPLLKPIDGEFTYLKSRPGLVLAGMEGLRYRKNSLRLQRGDRLFLYTDGVTEATDAKEELYGEERLAHILNASQGLSVEGICQAVKADVDAFVGQAPQFDDITMLCVDYIGMPGKDITVEPKLEEAPKLTEYVENTFTECGVPLGVVMKMNIALDEIFSNIVKYSGASYTKVTCGAIHSCAYLVFEDDGRAYDPLEQADPDTALSAEERNIGGLGIFMVKKSMSEVNYEYKDGKNMLRLKLKYGPSGS